MDLEIKKADTDLNADAVGTTETPEERFYRKRAEKIQRYNNMSAEDKLIWNIRKSAHIIKNHAMPSDGQDAALLTLYRKGDMSQKKLMEILDVKASSISETIGKLENAGLITRTQNEQDKRSVNISITEAGAAIAKEKLALRDTAMKEMFTSLSEKELMAMNTLFERLINDWYARFADEMIKQKAEKRAKKEKEDAKQEKKKK